MPLQDWKEKELADRLENDVCFPSERAGRVIDFHVHLFDPKQTASEILNAMDAAFVEKICLLVPTDSDEQALVLENLVQEGQGRIIAFAHIDKVEGNVTVDRIARLREKGLVSGIKILPNIHGCYPGDQRFHPVYEMAQEMGLPILFHAGIIGGLEHRSVYSRPVYFEDVARAFPRLNIVLAHMGWPWVEEAVAVAYMTPNVYLDISTGAPRIYKENALREALFVLGERKLIYGSDVIGPIDAPGLAHHLFDTRIMLQKIGVSRRVEFRIMHDNARTLLGLPRE